MEKLFYKDTHILDFEATVTECIPDENGEGYLIVLNRTAFFPEEGGQPADTGTLNEKPVLDVSIQKNMIYHLMEEALEIGQTVTGHVDWNRRFDFMQQHSGEHIISGLLHQKYGFTNVGFHLGLSEVTLDFDGVIDYEQLLEVEAEANHIVWENLPVKAYFPTCDELRLLKYRSKIEIEGAVRIIEIPGVDVCACCAPHVEKTGEIGIIKITGLQNHRGGVRINILCGERALKDYRSKADAVSQLSAVLSAKPELVVDGVEKLLEDIRTQKENVNALAIQLLQTLKATLPKPTVCKHPLLFVELDNPIAIRNLVNELTPMYRGYCGIFNGNDTKGYSFIIGSENLDCRQLAQLLREKLGAKGGGSIPMIQGNLKTTRVQLEDFFSQL